VQAQPRINELYSGSGEARRMESIFTKLALHLDLLEIQEADYKSNPGKIL
jgi:hypothetical protein